jgi:O-antigen ligase
MAITLRRPTLDENNQVYTAIMVGWGAVIGSAISFFLSGAILWALFRLYQRKIVLPQQREVILVGAAFALFFFSEALSGAINYGGTETLRQIAENLPFLGFLFVYGRLSLSSREDVLRSVEIGVITGAFGTLLSALFQMLVLDLPRAEGAAGNPGPFALVAAVLYGLAFLIALRRLGWVRNIALVAAIAVAGAMILSGMRALWPILAIAPVISLAIVRPGKNLPSFGRIALPAAVAGLVVVFFTYDVVYERVAKIADDYERVIENNDFDNSLGHRIRLWSAGLELAAERPVFGQGPGNAMDLSSERTAEQGRPLNFTHFHNFLLNAMVRSGIVGVAAILILLVAPVWMATRTPRDDIGNFGFAMLLTVQAVYILSGLFGIMLGHDITDALFIYSTIVASFLIWNGQPRARAGAPQ